MNEQAKYAAESLLQTYAALPPDDPMGKSVELVARAYLAALSPAFDAAGVREIVREAMFYAAELMGDTHGWQKTFDAVIAQHLDSFVARLAPHLRPVEADADERPVSEPFLRATGIDSDDPPKVAGTMVRLVIRAGVVRLNLSDGYYCIGIPTTIKTESDVRQLCRLLAVPMNETPNPAPIREAQP